MRRLSGLLGPFIACLVVGLAARRFVDVVEVRGDSMRPALRPGDRLIVVRGRRPAEVGDVVLALDPRDASRELVKRVAAVEGGLVTLRGDNASASTDARTFGGLPVSTIRWRVVARYWPLPRVGRLPTLEDR